jgi:hypothetical protein
MTVPDWHKRLVCGQCGSRNVDMVDTGLSGGERAGCDFMVAARRVSPSGHLRGFHEAFGRPSRMALMRQIRNRRRTENHKMLIA